MKKLSLFVLILLFSYQFKVIAQSCFPGDIWFGKQADIDNFQLNYPGVTEIEGRVIINDRDGAITNLDSLIVLTSISESLEIGYHDYQQGGTDLTNFEGLNNLTSIGGSLSVMVNPQLISFDGLENLTSIGGGLSVIFNNSLINITSLENLTSIGSSVTFWDNKILPSLSGLENADLNWGYLKIVNNDALRRLIGIQNFDANSITDLYIYGNDSLSDCEVQSICNYLSNPSGDVEIYNNVSGCNSQEEVEQACTVSVYETVTNYGISSYPNPFTTSTTIEYQLEQPSEVTLTIFNHLGEQVEQIRQHQQQGKQQVTWNAEGLPPGMYYYTLKAQDQLATGKMVFIGNN